MAANDKSAKASTPGVAAKPSSQGRAMLTEIGTTGLQRTGGYVSDEFLRQLMGRRAAKAFREIADNSPIAGGIILGYQNVATHLDWHIEEDPEADSADKAAYDFLVEAWDDMDEDWDSTLSQIMSMIVFGWSVHEVVYKRRDGKASQFSDNKIGWKGFPIRAQESLERWEFAQNGDTIAMIQQDPNQGGLITIPASKFLLFRTTELKNNPEGKALDPVTPIPTPDGWTTLGSLRVGDKVFDEGGAIRYVTALAEWNDRPVYKLTFADGTSIIADEEHEWFTRSAADRGRNLMGKIRTTREIFEKQHHKRGSQGEGWNFSIPTAAPLDYARQQLPFDPYVFGLWLGDGSKRAAQIASNRTDAEETASLIRERGFEAYVTLRPDSNGATINFTTEKWASDSPARILRAMGVYGNKSIPEGYLRGSIEQRLDLLRGLMDSDGSISPRGQAEFANTNRGLVDGVVELVRSLGWKPGIHPISPTHIDTYPHRPAWRVTFTPQGISPFALSRKVERVRQDKVWGGEHRIVSVDRVENRDTVCIEVDSPSHLFLAGEAMIPTHNSLLRAAYVPYQYVRRIQEYEAIGVERDLAGLPVAWVPMEWFTSEDANQKAAFDRMVRMVQEVRRNEREGIVLPMVYEPDLLGTQSHNKALDFQLLSSSGARQFDTDKIITRYNQQIGMSLLADFITMGHEGVGSFALGTAKLDLWVMVVDSLCKTIAQTFNRYAIKKLLDLNGFTYTKMPKLVYGEVENIDLSVIGAFVKTISDAGLLTPDEGTERWLREKASMPPAEVEGPPPGVQKLETEAAMAETTMQTMKEPPMLAARGGQPAAQKKPVPAKKPAAKPGVSRAAGK